MGERGGRENGRGGKREWEREGEGRMGEGGRENGRGVVGRKRN